MVHVVNSSQLQTILREAHAPTLVIYLDEPMKYPDQTDLIGDFWRHHDIPVNVCLLNSSTLNEVKDVVRIKGSPTYLLYAFGNTISAYHRKINPKDMDDLIQEMYRSQHVAKTSIQWEVAREYK